FIFPMAFASHWQSPMAQPRFLTASCGAMMRGMRMAYALLFGRLVLRLLALLVVLGPGISARCSMSSLQASQSQNPGSIFSAAQEALSAGDYAKAERGFREVLTIDPRSAAPYTDLGVVYLRTNRLDPAMQSLD